MRDELGDDSAADAIDALRRLANVPGVLSLQVERSLDERKGTVIVENLVVADEYALLAFREHPIHVEVVAFMRAITDWWVGDYIE
jgi:Stress responsive A/B Barrel Domain